VTFKVRERMGGMFEHGVAHAGTVLEPAEDDEQKIVDLAGCAEVADEEGDLPRALFDVEMTEIKAAKKGAEEYKFARQVVTEVHFVSTMGISDCWIASRPVRLR
jgi:hypothetical protein